MLTVSKWFDRVRFLSVLVVPLVLIFQGKNTRMNVIAFILVIAMVYEKPIRPTWG